jgi:proteasome lid subunit RPN8/RPN11
MDPFDDRVYVVIHRMVLDSIFAECDRYSDHETGGRLVGTYEVGRRRHLSITVSAVIEAGPNASRTATSFFQDGSYQEGIFRDLEASHPQIEHLGNWHTHHMNGYPTLSGGDRQTYHRVVNHKKHNTDFFYALLVTAKTADGYAVKHFVVYRNDPKEYEIPPSHVDIVDRPALWPLGLSGDNRDAANRKGGAAPARADQRARDSQYFAEFHPELHAFLSKKHGTVYWRGRVPMVDDSSPEIIVEEIPGPHGSNYEVSMMPDSVASIETIRRLSKRQFGSAREAVVLIEREINRAIFHAKVRELSQSSHPDGKMLESTKEKK